MARRFAALAYLLVYAIDTLQEFFKMAPDVVERRAKGLETYMVTIIQRFPDMLECSHLDRCVVYTSRALGLGCVLVKVTLNQRDSNKSNSRARPHFRSKPGSDYFIV